MFIQGENFQKSSEPTIPLAQVQSNTPSNEPINISSTPDCPLPNVFIPNELLIQKDLDILVAIRKRTHSDTKHPITKYLSYGKLSKKNKELLLPKSLTCLLQETFKKHLIIQIGNQQLWKI